MGLDDFARMTRQLLEAQITRSTAYSATMVSEILNLNCVGRAQQHRAKLSTDDTIAFGKFTVVVAVCTVQT